MNSHEIAALTTKTIEDLAAALEAGHSETLKRYLAAIGRFHKYSLHNVMLIVLQKPAATHVAGFHTYIQLHRGDAMLLLESLNYIRLAAGRILDGILEDRSLPEVRAA